MSVIIYKFNPDVVLENLGDGTGVFYLSRKNEILTLNSTAFFIAENINGQRSLAEIQKVFFDALDKSDLNLSEEQINKVCEDTLNCFVELGACRKEQF